MKTRRSGMAVKAVTWILAEVILNLVGLDNLADYSEFVFEQQSETFATYPAMTSAFVINRCSLPVFSA